MKTKKSYARLRLVTSEGRSVDSGYRSGRKRWRDTPETASMCSTRSAGTLPRVNHVETVLCPPRPKILAKAVCPPTVLQASKMACLHSTFGISAINAQTDNGVNARTDNPFHENKRMGKQTEYLPSAFWGRLDEALRGLPKWEPINANNVAKVLGMSQGSVHRWYKGDGLPELSTALVIAKDGGVCVDWLLNNVRPKHPISKDPVLKQLFEICEDLDNDARDRVLRAARGELLQKQGEKRNESQRRIG